MVRETLEIIDYIHGSTTLIFVLASILIGLILLTKYRRLKRKEIITVGFAWIFLSSAWWGSSLSFVLILLLDIQLLEFIFFFVANVFIPLAVVCWIYSFSHILYPDSEKIITIPFIILSVMYEIVLIFLLFIPSSYPEYIGEIKTLFYYKPGLLTLIFQLLAIVITIITGFIFSIKSMKASDPRVKWKGRFLFLAFLLFIIAAIFDAVITLDELLIIITRSLLLVSSLFYYLGFLLPDRLAELLGALNES